MREWLDALLTVVLAPTCAACARVLSSPTRGPVCPSCWLSIHPLTPPLCDTCGDPLPTWRALDGNSPQCVRCRRRRPLIDRLRAVGAYEGALRSIVHALKYDGRRSLAPPLAALMRQRGADVIAGATAAVPVPLHPSRQRARGFNQAADLATHLGLPVVPALRRTRPTAVQAELPAAKRYLNVSGAFTVTRQARDLHGVIVLVDDVSTTGATLDACAHALKQAGVREVRALTAARVVTAPR